MSDLISRQDAIDAVTDELDMIDHVPQWVFDRLEKRLKQLPSEHSEYTMEEFMFGQDMGNPEDGSL